LKFDSIFFTDEDPIDKENSIWGRKVQNQMFKDSIRSCWKINEFMKGLIIRKVVFKSI